MATSKAEVRGLSLVLLGDFNPTIFQPRWFASEKLMTPSEAEEADIQIVHPDVTIFQLSWISVNVSRERAIFSCTAQPYFDRVVALASQVFELLRHTPIKMLGINHEAHIRASSTEKWNTLGDNLAPKGFWREFFDKPGLQTLAIRQIPRPDEKKGHIEVNVAPSVRISNGVFVRINDHFDFAKSSDPGSELAVTTLRDSWPNSMAFAERIFLQIERNAQ